jgi:hypothetical protein
LIASVTRLRLVPRRLAMSLIGMCCSTISIT